LDSLKSDINDLLTDNEKDDLNKKDKELFNIYTTGYILNKYRHQE
jgi:hypothetical protein